MVNEHKMNANQMMFEPSQLTPLINDRCESLKILFGAMRDILNSLRPHQAKQTVIQTLHKQLLYKENKLKLINENIMAGQKICNQQLNVKKSNNEANEQDIDLFFSSSTDNNHTQESIKRLKQTLNESFYFYE
eukprot:UN13571